MFKRGLALLTLVALLLAACGGHGDTANCLDRTRPEEPVVVDPSFCRDVNPSGGGFSGGDNFLLYYLLFSHAFMPYGTIATPAVINHYHATTVVNKSTTYKTQTGGVIKADKTGKATVAKASPLAKPRTVSPPSAPKAAPVPQPVAPAKPPAVKPSSPSRVSPPSSPPRSSPPPSGRR